MGILDGFLDPLNSFREVQLQVATLHGTEVFFWGRLWVWR